MGPATVPEKERKDEINVELERNEELYHLAVRKKRQQSS